MTSTLPDTRTRLCTTRCTTTTTDLARCRTDHRHTDHCTSRCSSQVTRRTCPPDMLHSPCHSRSTCRPGSSTDWESSNQGCTHTRQHTAHCSSRSSDPTLSRTDPPHTVRCTLSSPGQSCCRTVPRDTDCNRPRLQQSTGQQRRSRSCCSTSPQDSSSPLHTALRTSTLSHHCWSRTDRGRTDRCTLPSSDPTYYHMCPHCSSHTHPTPTRCTAPPGTATP